MKTKHILNYEMCKSPLETRLFHSDPETGCCILGNRVWEPQPRIHPHAGHLLPDRQVSWALSLGEGLQTVGKAPRPTEEADRLHKEV